MYKIKSRRSSKTNQTPSGNCAHNLRVPNIDLSITTTNFSCYSCPFLSTPIKRQFDSDTILLIPHVLQALTYKHSNPFCLLLASIQAHSVPQRLLSTIPQQFHTDTFCFLSKNIYLCIYSLLESSLRTIQAGECRQ